MEFPKRQESGVSYSLLEVNSASPRSTKKQNVSFYVVFSIFIAGEIYIHPHIISIRRVYAYLLFFA